MLILGLGLKDLAVWPKKVKANKTEKVLL